MPQHDFRGPRLFVDAALSAGQTVMLERNQGNYLGNVLRLAAGDTILVFNGHDGEWQARIDGRKRPDSLTILAQSRPQDHLPDLTYVFAPLKHARLDYMVQKAVEMGASALQPVLTRFTQLDVLIGPEGGFAEDERAILLRQPRILRISLGPRILRADTAAVAALTLAQAVLGDWAGIRS
jgi:16S rRNA U1498 N3-methylase RsmE